MRMRKYYPVAVLLILLAAIALSASLVTTNANALPTFTNAVGGIGPCASCHTKTGTHGLSFHATVYPTCSNCHVNGDTAVPPTPAKCGVCHGGTSAILVSTMHAAKGCSTTVGCHGVTAPAPFATKVTLKVAPTLIRLSKKVKATGAVTPVGKLVGKKVSLTAQRKVGTKWVKVKAATATVNATNAYAWTYKPAKKGTYRMRTTIKATATYKGSRSLWKSFKVK